MYQIIWKLFICS